jgi:hypothetical protein
MEMKLLGIINVDFDVTDKLMIVSVPVKYWRKNGSVMVQCISYL